MRSIKEEQATEGTGLDLDKAGINTKVLTKPLYRPEPFKFSKEKEKHILGMGTATLFKASDDTHILEIKAGVLFRRFNTLLETDQLNSLISLAKPFSNRLKTIKVLNVSEQTLIKNNTLNAELNVASCLIKRDGLIQNINIILIRRGKKITLFAHDKRKISIETVYKFMNS